MTSRHLQDVILWTILMSHFTPGVNSPCQLDFFIFLTLKCKSTPGILSCPVSIANHLMPKRRNTNLRWERSYHQAPTGWYASNYFIVTFHTYLTYQYMMWLWFFLSQSHLLSCLVRFPYLKKQRGEKWKTHCRPTCLASKWTSHLAVNSLALGESKMKWDTTMAPLEKSYREKSKKTWT